MSWIQDARTVAVGRVAQELGIDLAKRGLAWCPVCMHRGHGSAKTSKGADGADRWKCFRCGEGGDVVDLASAVVGRGRVRGWFARRGWCQGRTEAPVQWVPPTPPPGGEVDEPKPPPPHAQVAALLARCRPAAEVPVVLQWLEQRLGAAGASAQVSALPDGGDLPVWASFRRQRWDLAGYRAILPTYDATGSVRSVRARQVDGGEGPKTIAPTGYGVRGLVMANPAGVAMLRGEAKPSSVVIVEGDPAFLAWSVASAPGVAVLGIVQGSWTPEIAAKVPALTQVGVCTDPDEAGEKYKTQIVNTLKGRCYLHCARLVQA